MAAVAAERTAPLPPPIPNEVISTEKIPQNLRHLVYLDDMLPGHWVDSRITIFNGDSRKLIGIVPTSFAGVMTLNHDGSRLYTASSYFSRGVRGTRTDVLQVTDTRTLNSEWEVVLPSQRAEALPVPGLLALTTGDRFAIVQNATPATSLTVVDLAKRVVSSEIATPGCWSVIVWPSDPDRISTICGDGTLLTIQIGADGKPLEQTRSAPIFNADIDPAFTNVVFLDDVAYFVTFSGQVMEVTQKGGEVRKAKQWSLIGVDDKPKNWLPGGYELTAIHTASKRLFVLMHSNGAEGSHKAPAEEIWAFDLPSRKRVDRAPGSMALSLSVTQDPDPRLFVVDISSSKLIDYSIAGKIRKLGETADAAVDFSPSLQSR